MKIKFKMIIKAWLITASIAAIINLVWFYINTAKNGNPWSDVIGIIPILVMSFATIFIGSVIYWLMTFKIKKAEFIFAAFALIIATLSVMGHPNLKDGTPVPPEFRTMDIPMHFVAGILCAFLIPIISNRGKNNLKQDV
jgi:hypothetical protein